jgi:hypothetical protein
VFGNTSLETRVWKHVLYHIKMKWQFIKFNFTRYTTENNNLCHQQSAKEDAHLLAISGIATIDNNIPYLYICLPDKSRTQVHASSQSVGLQLSKLLSYYMLATN